MFNKIDYKKLAICAICTAIIAVICFWIIFAQDEGQLGSNWYYPVRVSEVIFAIITFPGVAFFENLLHLHYSICLLAGIFIDCLLYGFLAERVMIKFKSRKLKKS